MTEERAGLPIIAFNDLAALERWLDSQPANSPGLWIKLAKAHSGIESVTKTEAIDAALCHGWIDGQLDKYDDASWLIRFTPRKVRSKWSQVNRARAEELLAAGRAKEGTRPYRASSSDCRLCAHWGSNAPSMRAVGRTMTTRHQQTLSR
jgi:uncharacterized protein YdeI (YjbR/CyaY-like superfamily)